MKHFIKNLLIVGGVFIVGAANAATPFLGKRYCEIVYSSDYVDFYVFNTTSVNDCPAKWWQSLGTNKLKKQLRASYIFLNGPRYWLIDDITHLPIKTETTHINGVNLPLVAKFHTNFQSLLRRHGPYVDYAVQRPQIYHFHSGREIYELVNPQGQTYVLHSISIKHQQQNLKTLGRLKQQIHLPKGWAFKSEILAKDLKLTPKNNTIHVVMDEFDNTYELKN